MRACSVSLTGDHSRTIDTELATTTCLGSGNELAYHRIQGYVTLDDIAAASFEVDPPFVEAVEHADARHRVLHALLLEHIAPGIARHDLRAHRLAEHG